MQFFTNISTTSAGLVQHSDLKTLSLCFTSFPVEYENKSSSLSFKRGSDQHNNDPFLLMVPVILIMRTVNHLLINYSSPIL